MSRSNLAVALESEDILDTQTQTTNTLSLEQLLELSSTPVAAGKLSRVTERPKRLKPAVFKDNFSGDFRLFRFY